MKNMDRRKFNTTFYYKIGAAITVVLVLITFFKTFVLTPDESDAIQETMVKTLPFNAIYKKAFPEQQQLSKDIAQQTIFENKYTELIGQINFEGLMDESRKYMNEIQDEINLLPACNVTEAIRCSGKTQYQQTSWYDMDGNIKDKSCRGRGSLLRQTDEETVVLDGAGVIECSDGIKLFGRFENDHQVGLHYETDARGRVIFKGEYPVVEQGVTGYAEFYKFEPNEYYKGSVLNDLYSGIGLLVTEESIYDGEFDAEQANGQGKKWTKEGCFYEGGFKNGVYSGYGDLVCTNYIYKGEFRNGLAHGAGSIWYTDGVQYTGVWFDDQRDGYGAYHTPEGKIFIGNWTKNLLNDARASVLYPDGTIYTGGYKNDTMHGQARWIGPMWEQKANYLNGSFHGEVITIDQAGSKYNNYKNGELHGPQRYENLNGEVSIENYVDGSVIIPTKWISSEGEIFNCDASFQNCTPIEK
tara:strand:- start:122 stop:1528 length:1407 start_codon:yes stop_codon:yes gene_type:complete